MERTKRKPAARSAKPGSAGKWRPAQRTTWEVGVVDRRADYIELCYGSGMRPVARVGRNRAKHILVQFLVNESGNAASRQMLSDVRDELTYYLFGVAGPHAWAFARFHCDTPANLASRVRWNWHPCRAV